MDVDSGLGLMAACYGAGALSSLLARWSGRLALGVGHLAALAGAVAGLGVSLGVLLGAPGRTLTQPLPDLFPFARLSLSVDGLSAYFLLVISLVAVAAAIYGPAYLRAHSPDAGPARQAAQVLALNVFLGCMAFVCCAGDALTFLLCWEGMTLASYVLVVSDDRDGENARAGLLYMVMAHGGTALLLVAFLALTERAGAFDFAALRAAAGGLDGTTRTTLFFLALGGFATKAGVVPLHVWLPRAHPAAPSHVSALMSGVMLKVAIYGILRFAFDLLAPAAGPLPSSWGWTVLVRGHDLGRARRALRAPAARPQAPARVPQRREHRDHPHRGGAGDDSVAPGGRGRRPRDRRAHRRAPSHRQPRGIQGPPLPRRGQRPLPHARPQHGGARRARPAHALDGGAVPARRRRDLGAPPAQRVRQRVAHLPGPPRRRQPLPRPRRARHRLLRGDAGAHGRPRRRVLREGVRRHVPRPAANAPRRARHRGAALDDRRHGCGSGRCAWPSASRRATRCACSTRRRPGCSTAPGRAPS